MQHQTITLGTNPLGTYSIKELSPLGPDCSPEVLKWNVACTPKEKKNSSKDSKVKTMIYQRLVQPPGADQLTKQEELPSSHSCQRSLEPTQQNLEDLNVTLLNVTLEQSLQREILQNTTQNITPKIKKGLENKATQIEYISYFLPNYLYFLDCRVTHGLPFCTDTINTVIVCQFLIMFIVFTLVKETKQTMNVAKGNP